MNLRSDPSTLAIQQTCAFAGTRKSGWSWSSQMWRSWAPAPNHPGDDDIGCSSLVSRRGAQTLPEDAPRKRVTTFGPRALHSAKLGPCRSRQQCLELLPSTEADAIARTVIAAKAATPPRGGRGEGRQKAWLLGVVSGLHRPRSTARWKEEAAHPPDSTRKRGRLGAPAGKSTENGGATHRMETRTGATASRGGGFTARGRARAS
jgi:hypothetical protein